jgi:hypothetical protein
MLITKMLDLYKTFMLDIYGGFKRVITQAVQGAACLGIYRIIISIFCMCQFLSYSILFSMIYAPTY